MCKLTERFYLAKLYKRFLIFFWVAVFFIAGHIFFIYKGVNTFPFILWGMYSGKFYPQENYRAYEIYVNNNLLTLNSLPQPTHSQILSVISKYNRLAESNFNESINYAIDDRFKGKLPPALYRHVQNSLTNTAHIKEPFKAWLKRYMEYILEKEIRSITAVKKIYTYGPDFYLKPVSEEVVLSYEY